MRKTILVLVPVLLLAACERQYVPNPDPNHTHADFAVWDDGEKVDFSGEDLMSGFEDDHDHEHEHRHDYLHLHDKVGHVVHRHKPGLSLQEFFESLNYTFPEPIERWTMWINEEQMDFDLQYVFKDMDQVLLTNSAGSAQVLYEVEQLTDDACRYSKTCPWKGEPPAENCIADPEVPCVVPLEDL
jgi:hypothetical protein